MDKTIVHDDPEIFTIDNFIDYNVCQHFINISKNSLVQSVVSNDINGFVSPGRTSSNTWIDHNHDEITLSIAKKIANIVDIPIENAEKFQVVYYNTTQEYKNHYDSWEHDYSEKTLRCMKTGGARLKTALVYLNDVEEGGGTNMSRLNKLINPVKGKLLVFNNTYKHTNIRHPLSEHAGTPVIKGEKYIFNLWFRECERYRLYKEFNPDYYKQTNNVSIFPPTPPSNLIKNCPDNIVNDIVHKPTHNFVLEEGDYFPFVTINCITSSKHIHNFVDDKHFIFIVVKNIEIIKDLKFNNNFNYFIFYKNNLPLQFIRHISCNDSNIYNLFQDSGDKIHIYFLTPNRKIYKKTILDSFDEFNNITLDINKQFVYNIPYLLIDNVFSPKLLDKILTYYNNNITRHTTHNTTTKNRHHIHPDRELEIEIDNKLSRSLFPEIKKIFYFDVKYREAYKICSYDSDTNGRFHSHRDTPSPYQHRKFAMSLILTDDYEGGEFELPEYNFKIKPKANSALIFPGICSHKVNPVTKGSRKAIISFFCSEIEGKTKDNTAYTVKSDFFKDNNIQFSEIYPK